MDVGLLYFGIGAVFVFGLLGLVVRKDIALLFPFIGGVLAIIFMAQLNTDGAIQGLASGASDSIWPMGYLFILGVIVDFGIAAYRGTS